MSFAKKQFGGVSLGAGMGKSILVCKNKSQCTKKNLKEYELVRYNLTKTVGSNK